MSTSTAEIRTSDTASNVSYKLLRQREAAKLIRDQLREEGVDDLDSIEIAIESETRLQEVVSEAFDKIDENDILEIGLTAKIEAFTERRAAIRKQNDFIRAAIEQAMTVADLETLRLPTATVSLRRVKPSVVVEEEASIPSKFWTPQDAPPPKLDKKKLLEALEAGEETPGARLNNGTVCLSVRRK